MWYVSSRSGVATLWTAIHLLLTYLLIPEYTSFNFNNDLQSRKGRVPRVSQGGCAYGVFWTYRSVWVLVSVRINTRHDVEVVTVEKRTQRLVEYVVDDQLYTTQHSLSTQRIQVATVMRSTARITATVQIVLSFSPGVHPVQKRDWLTPRIPRTVYRYFWAYPFLFFLVFPTF